MGKNKFSILKAYHFPKLICEPDAEVTLCLTWLEPGFSSLMTICPGAVQVTREEGAWKGSSVTTPNTVNFPGGTNPGCHRQ